MSAARTAAARRVRPAMRRSSFFMRLSAAFSHVILLAQALGLLANGIWAAELSTADVVGFLYVGGDIAGLFAYFGFFLFGALFFWLAPRRFWVSLHPATLGLALMMLASHRLWGAHGVWLALAAAGGALAGRQAFRLALLHPRRALLALALCLPLARFALPRELAPYAITGTGAFLLALALLPPLLRCRRQRRR